MKHFLVLSTKEFFITCGASQVDNVREVLKQLTETEIKLVRRAANKCKIVVRRDPVRAKLLSLILLISSEILSIGIST